MRSALHLKFFIVYIAFGFLILFSVSAIAPQMLSYRLEKQLLRGFTPTLQPYLPNIFPNIFQKIFLFQMSICN